MKATIYQEIVLGEHDNSLNEIIEAVGIRQKRLGGQLFDLLQPGDQIEIDTTRMKPKYLDGAIATVVEKRISKFVVEFGILSNDHDPYRKFSGKRWVFSPEHIKSVVPAAAADED